MSSTGQRVTYIRVYGDWEDELVVLAIEVVKMVSPNVLNVPWIDEPVAVGG